MPLFQRPKKCLSNTSLSTFVLLHLRKALGRFAAVLILLLMGTVVVGAASEADFLAPEQAFVLSAQQTAPDMLELRFDIAPGYYMYRERFDLTAQPLQAIRVNAAEYPLGDTKYDSTFDREMEVYHQEVRIKVPLVPDGQAARLMVMSQGCADAGLCYPPMGHAVDLTPTAGGYRIEVAALEPGTVGTANSVTAHTPLSVASTSQARLSGLLVAGDTRLANVISEFGLAQTVGIFFLLGLLLAFTPCVLPMIPILSAIVIRPSPQKPMRTRGLALAAFYVLGMSLVYTALGVAAGLSGVGLAAWLQTPWVLILFAVLLVLLALSMFDAYTLQLPATWQASLTTRSNKIPGGRYAGAWLMGAISALIVGPCVAAPLAGALLYISQTRDVVLGGAALFAMAWGMGVPLLLVGASAGTLLPKAGPWMNGVKRLFGMLLLATAWWMLVSVLPTWLLMLGWALLAMVAAVMLQAFERLPNDTGVPRIFAKGLGLLLAIAALAWTIGVASGGRDVLRPLQHLANKVVTSENQSAAVAFQRVNRMAELDTMLTKSTRAVMLDFYADWCVSCREMEHFTFTDPQVIQRMNQLQVLQIDVTQNNAEHRALLKRFQLFGPPGILFFSPGGQLLEQPRVIGFQDVARFTATLDQVLAR